MENKKKKLEENIKKKHTEKFELQTGNGGYPVLWGFLRLGIA